MSRWSALVARGPDVLSHRAFEVFALALVLVLHLPALRGGWTRDDLIHRSSLSGETPFGLHERGGLDIFVYFDGDGARTRELVDRGLSFWWTYDGIRNGVWRPLAAFSHWIDVHVLTDRAVLAHAHSVAWLLGVVAVAFALYRKLYGRGILAALAGVIFALDEAHVSAATWVGNRNTLIAALFGLTALLTHVSWRRRGGKMFVVLSPTLLLLSLLAKEEAIAVGAYLAAHALFLETGGARRKLASLAPHALAALVWLFLYQAHQVGAWGVGHYIDPADDPGAFALAALERLPVLALGAFFVPPSDWFHLGSDTTRVLHYGLALGFLAASGLVGIPVLRASATARFWAFGSLLSLVPLCAALPGERLLVFPAVGVAALISEMAQTLWGVSGRTAGPPRRLRSVAAALTAGMLAVHLVYAPIVSVVNMIAFGRANAANERRTASLPADPEIARQRLILVTAPSNFHVGHHVWQNFLLGKPFPRHSTAMALPRQEVRVTRRDERTLVVAPEGAFFPDVPSAWVVRDKDHPMAVGDTIRLSDLEIEVTDVTPDGRPVEAAFRFHDPLESPSLRWMVWDSDGFADFEPPAVGESRILGPR